MFEGLNWRAAARRSAIVIGIYIALFYILGVAFPKTFGLGDRGELTGLLINAGVFFFVFTFVYAFVERNKNRRIEQAKKNQNQAAKSDRPEGDPEVPGALKGRPNPNTSRRKNRRKR